MPEHSQQLTKATATLGEMEVIKLREGSVTEMAEQPRNTWSQVQRGWARRLQLKVTYSSCSKPSEQYKIGNIAEGGWGWQLLYLMGRCCQQRGGWAMAGDTMIMGDDDLGPCQGEHPTPWHSISFL